jgi:hypothetical protein
VLASFRQRSNILGEPMFSGTNDLFAVSKNRPMHPAAETWRK